MTVRPLRTIEHRIPEAGRIRLGEKHGKAMRALSNFRFTSQHKELIDALAAKYGGEPRRWRDDKANPPDQWEVYTNVNRIPVAVPQRAISTWYELWSGGGRIRQCDGERCDIVGHDDMQTVPCICEKQNKLDCRPYTRIIVIPTEIPFHGVWLLQSKGWNVMHEMPGMAELVAQVSTQSITRAFLGIDQRQKRVNGKVSKFVVPTLTLDVTPLELAAGHAGLLALGNTTADAAALPAAPVALTAPVDDDVVDGEVVELSPLQERAYLCADQFGMDRAQFWMGLTRYANNDQERITKGLTLMERGAIEPTGFSADGKIVIVAGPNS